MPMKINIFAATIGALLLLCCSACGEERLPPGISNEFFWASNNQQNALFQRYDFESQYQIYIYGVEKIEPPDTGLAWELARQGPKIVPPLRAKLDSTDNDRRIVYIIHVFTAMNDLGTYHVADDKNLMDDLRLKISGMKDEFWQVVAERELTAIREKPQKKAKA